MFIYLSGYTTEQHNKSYLLVICRNDKRKIAGSTTDVHRDETYRM